MAHNIVDTRGMPTDQPIEERPGVMHREADYHGNAKWYALPPESIERAEKGDLGLSVIPGLESKPLETPGVPWKNERTGRE
jgi:hypothetical protein